MRKILSLSLPEKTVKSIKRRAQKRGFRSVSAYFQFLLQEDEDLISEEELLAAVEEGRKEYEKGKTIKAKSLADLV